MEFLKAFANHNEYSAFTGTSEFVKPNVSYCIAENENHYNPIKLELFDYIYSDGTFSSNIQNKKTCVGIVVAPESHFSDGKCRVMSINEMYDQADWNNPTEHSGSTSGTVSFENTSGLHGDGGPSIITINADNSYNSSKLYGHFPSNGFSKNYTQEIDGVSYTYWSKYYENTNNIPSPFLEDGESKNMIYTYSGTSDAAINNILVLTEKGKECSDMIIDYYANSSITVNGITVSSGCPAASACRLYSPNFHDGEWYLPTIGELGYVMVNLNTINEKLSAIQAPQIALDYYWSSLYYNDNFRWAINFSNGQVDTNRRYYYNIRARAFLAIKL